MGVPGATHQVAISAHRGGSERYPGDTWEAYRAAVAAGADYVEFDVRRTSDGELVVYHGKRTEVTTRMLPTLSRSQLEAAAGRDLPSLRDLLNLLAGHAKAHIDVKEPGYEAAVVADAMAVLGPDGFVVTGIDVVMIDVKRADPRAPTALSVGRGVFEVPLSRMLQVRASELRPVRRIRACGADGVAMQHRLARAGALAEVARHGIPAMIWTVNDPALIRRFVADPRVTVLVTDRPELAVQLRDDHA